MSTGTEYANMGMAEADVPVGTHGADVTGDAISSSQDFPQKVPVIFQVPWMRRVHGAEARSGGNLGM